MKSLVKAVVLSLALVFVAARAEAYPLLQLDIFGGTYDPITQTTISDGPDFTLVALLTPKATDNLAALMSDTYYISAALMPKVGPAHSPVGSYTWNGVTYQSTGDMTYGTPPIEGLNLADYDAYDLNDPQVFPTFFNEFAFNFDLNQRALIHDVRFNPGDPVPTTSTTGVSYFQTFNVTTSFSGPNVLHFNLYDTLLKRCVVTGCVMDEDVDHFAPLSADAESNNLGVPEPASAALMSLGLAFALNRIRRKE